MTAKHKRGALKKKIPASNVTLQINSANSGVTPSPAEVQRYTITHLKTKQQAQLKCYDMKWSQLLSGREETNLNTG